MENIKLSHLELLFKYFIALNDGEEFVFLRNVIATNKNLHLYPEFTNTFNLSYIGRWDALTICQVICLPLDVMILKVSVAHFGHIYISAQYFLENTK